MQTLTGAAQTWFVVNRPATTAGTSETMSARSRFLPLFEPLPVPSRLMSQKTPEVLKPCGAITEPDISFSLVFNYREFIFRGPNGGPRIPGKPANHPRSWHACLREY